MNRSRRDSKGRTLHKGEVQRSSDKTYMYTYTDPFGKRHFVYAKVIITLREKERELQRDQLDGIQTYAAGRATVNEAFDRYMSTKYNLKEHTRSNFLICMTATSGNHSERRSSHRSSSRMSFNITSTF